MENNFTISKSFDEIVRHYGKRQALSFKQEHKYHDLSYEQLSEKVKTLAAGLITLGIKKNDKVALLSQNCPEWAIADLAIMKAGAINVPLHTTLSPKILAYVINHCRARFLLVGDRQLWDKFSLISEPLDSLEKIVCLPEISDEEKGKFTQQFFGWEEVMALGRQNKEIIFPETSAEETASIIYTSGTTGLPKGVCLTHRNFISNVDAIKQAVSVTQTDVFLSVLPLSHVLERTAGYYTPLLSGSHIYYAQSLKELPRNLPEARPTIFISVPRIFEKFHDKIWDQMKSGSRLKRKIFFWALKQKAGTLSYLIADKVVFKKVRHRLGGNLRFTVSGGASLDLKIAKFFQKMGIIILEGYGLTETAPVLAANRENDFKLGTVGQPMDNIELKIAADKEILARGPSVMKGYYQNQEETENTIDAEGWLHTGDLGFLDSDNFLTIIGRKKEMMCTSGGKNIWPDPLEQLLNIDKFIDRSAVIAHKCRFVSALIIPDWEEVNLHFKDNEYKNKAALINDPKIIALFQQRLDEINKHLPDYEQIKKFALLIDDFSQEKDELTPTLKLRRHVIDKNYKREIEIIYG